MILVIGATGTVGREVVKLLDKSGQIFRLLVRSPGKAALFSEYKADIAFGDLSHPATLIQAMQGVDKVFLASSTDLNQVEWQGNAIRAALVAGARHIVKLSALGAKAKSPFQLGRMHYQTEKQIEVSGIAYTHLRPHSFLQNLLMLASSIIKDNAFYAPLGNAQISMVDARDIAGVAAMALTTKGHEGKTYNITGAIPITYDQVADEISKVLARRVTYVDISDDVAFQAMSQFGVAGWLAEDLIALYRQFRRGGGELVTQTVKNITGNDPIRLDQFVKDYSQVFKGDLRTVPVGLV
jgi:uncharacterized protein YbjT (DUF2867 family)